MEIAGWGAPDLVLAIVDEFGPTAVEERPASIRIFFAVRAARDLALAALVAADWRASSLDVDDEDWARRSQERLRAVTIGRLTVAPPWAIPKAASSAPSVTVVIQPSMGFGTGHHATTRLCLAALQAVPLDHATVLDVGTGSGVLAIAASRLGAACAVGIDSDADAIQSARENLPLNPGILGVEFRVATLGVDELPTADVVTANLTGAVLVRSAPLLLSAVRRGGTLIVSGLLVAERRAVLEALGPAGPAWEATEDEWACLAMACGR